MAEAMISETDLLFGQNGGYDRVVITSILPNPVHEIESQNHV
jgi:hypothetical protein